MGGMPGQEDHAHGHSHGGEEKCSHKHKMPKISSPFQWVNSLLLKIVTLKKNYHIFIKGRITHYLFIALEVERPVNGVSHGLISKRITINLPISCSRGVVRNLVDVLDIRCCGLFRPSSVDWTTHYSLDAESKATLRTALGMDQKSYEFVWWECKPLYLVSWCLWKGWTFTFKNPII